ncbi:MAG TPA: N-acetylmuramic acid 6-phosphate etherase [Candidatus Methylacidiphilales bacterium]|jgi:N-acetylmuramic acid 6-phosphate etherase|nr:N-acetylmuramic acid 6-phosphate etherase [Candidatus Methylacidiphilales bacterium]
MAGRKKAAGILGIEGGGTKTTWALLTRQGKILAQGAAGPGNTLLLTDAGLERLLRAIRRAAGTGVEAIGGAFAGCQLAAEKVRVGKIVRRIWPKARVVRVMEDTRSVLAAAFGDGPGIVVIAGTGSNVAGQKSARDPIEKAGGWGHLFSDGGSAYDIARLGLQCVYTTYDATKKVDVLGREFLAAAGKDSLEELVPFLLRDTGKTTVAGWARCVFSAAKKGDRIASLVLDQGASELADRVQYVTRRLNLLHARVALTGGLFKNQPDYVRRFKAALRRVRPGATLFLLEEPGVFGAARLAGLEKLPDDVDSKGSRRAPRDGPAQGLRRLSDPARIAAFALASTEQRNPRSRGLDNRSIPGLVDLFIREERHVQKALAAQRNEIARAAALVAKRLSAGGRLFYVGAGTSGRLGVVDASEMPPTFNAPPEQVQAIIAGGAAAVFKSQEGAEDARDTGAAELFSRGLTKRDVVCGIAASGQTPFVLGALDYARGVGAGTILLTCNPKRSIRVPVGVEIDLPTGPEIVTGSTRLKAGTATKLVLNMLSTIAMVRLGRVRDNLMINVQATNDKLRARAVRLVRALTRSDDAGAQTALEKSGWRVADAVKALKQRHR